MYNRQFDPFFAKHNVSFTAAQTSYVIHPKGDQSMGLVREGGGGIHLRCGVLACYDTEDWAACSRALSTCTISTKVGRWVQSAAVHAHTQTQTQQNPISTKIERIRV